MKAIISDIHSNYAALEATLADIQKVGITDIVCLGDIVGYGPQPRECLDAVRQICDLVLLGNHEEAIMFGAVNFNLKARRAVDWTRQVLLEALADSPELRSARRKYMETFQPEMKIEGVKYVHASPRQPTREYVTPKDAFDHHKMADIFDHLEDYCFCGHTHTPGIFTQEGFTHPSEMFDLYMIGTDEKVLINVGSVGQPRDGDPRACYVTFDGDTVTWRRVKYDVVSTCRKIYQIQQLDNFLAERLREGK